MIFRKVDARTVVFVADDHETELCRVVLPSGRVSAEEMAQFIEHFMKESKSRQVWPS